MTSPQSPLAEIRSAELAAARSLADASEQATEAMAGARVEAARIVEEGRTRGDDAADERFAAVVAKADARATEILEAVGGRITHLRGQVEPQLDTLVEQLLAVVLPEPE